MTLYEPMYACPICKKKYLQFEIYHCKFSIELDNAVSDHRCPDCDVECEQLPFEQWETISDNTFY